MDIISFVTEHYIMFIIVGIVFFMTIIGYIAQKIGFGNKVSKNNKEKENNIKDSSSEDVEVLNDLDTNEENNNHSEQLDVLDTIAPNFNNEGLMVGDVNQNPAASNEDLGIPEDLYAPFGDQNVEPSIEELKIEDVDDKDDFNIIEKDTNKNQDEDAVINEITDSLSPKDNNVEIDNLHIEDVVPDEATETIIEQEKPNDKVAESISNLVDNTFVINDGTSDFIELEPKVSNETVENQEDNYKINKPTNEEKVEENQDTNSNDNSTEKSKIEQFVIDDADMEENIDDNDLGLEATTNLKLDEINEQIKNLKLEDLENSFVDDDNIKNKRKNRKSVSIKSVDEIKNTENNNNKNSDDVFQMNLPDLNNLEQRQNDEVNEEDIWNF